MKLFFTIFSLLVIHTAFAQSALDGQWTAIIEYNDIAVPASFTIAQGDEIQVTFTNGLEKLVQTATVADDSLLIPLKPFDAYLKLALGDTLRGFWIKNYRNSKISIKAFPGNHRVQIETNKDALFDELLIRLNPGMGNEYPGLMTMSMMGKHATATILTEVGDYRYFEGFVNKDSMALSSFDGAHAFMITGRKSKKGWSGQLYLDNGYKERWEQALRDPDSLASPFDMQRVEGAEVSPYFDLLALGNGPDFLKEEDFLGKVTILQLFGTWCPNSYDQVNFLKDWYKENNSDALQLIGLSYEVNYSKEYGMKRIEEYKEAMEVPFPIYLGSGMSKRMAAMAFPNIESLQAFPTLILMDRNAKIRKIFSYFTGPATGEYYDLFKRRFQEEVEALLNE